MGIAIVTFVALFLFIASAGALLFYQGSDDEAPGRASFHRTYKPQTGLPG